MKVLFLGDECKIKIPQKIPCGDRIQLGTVIAYKKESAVQRDLLHTSGVEMNTADKDKVPGRTDQKPPVKAAVFVVKLLSIYEA